MSNTEGEEAGRTNDQVHVRHVISAHSHALGLEPHAEGAGRSFLWSRGMPGDQSPRLQSPGLRAISTLQFPFPHSKIVFKAGLSWVSHIHRENQDLVGVCCLTWSLPGAGELKPRGTRGRCLRAVTALAGYLSYTPSHR